MYLDCCEHLSSNLACFSVCSGLLINLFSSVAIIQLNKYIYVNYGYPNMSLTCLHFIFTFLGLTILAKLGIFTIKKVNKANIFNILTVTHCKHRGSLKISGFKCDILISGAKKFLILY